MSLTCLVNDNRDRLRANVLLKEYALDVELGHLSLFSEELGNSVQERPGDVLPLVSPLQ